MGQESASWFTIGMMVSQKLRASLGSGSQVSEDQFVGSVLVLPMTSLSPCTYPSSLLAFITISSAFHRTGLLPPLAVYFLLFAFLHRALAASYEMMAQLKEKRQ